MARVIRLPCLVLALALAQTASSQDPVDVIDAGVARVFTHDARPADCVSPVVIRRIDGRDLAVDDARPDDAGLVLEPGVHSLTGTAHLVTARCKTARGSADTRIDPLEAVFEGGNDYYVGLDHGADDAADWALVIWKVVPRDGGDADTAEPQ